MAKMSKDFIQWINVILQMAMSKVDSCRCGTALDDISIRIVGGQQTEPHSNPWAVAITLGGEMHCGGTVITNKHILSAGHCFYWDFLEFMDVILGIDSFKDMTDVVTRKIVHTVIHEDFKSTAIRDENDIAIGTLNKPVEFGLTISPICLPEQNQDFSNLIALIIGWGRVGVRMENSKHLLQASVKILSNKECLKSKLRDHLTPTMMCAFFKGKDGCQGDSGGPLLVLMDKRYVIAGIVSWGIGCANPSYPGVYTNVSCYVDWIKNNTADGKTCI